MPPLIVFAKTIKGGHFKMSPLMVILQSNFSPLSKLSFSVKTIKGGHFKMPPLIVFAKAIKEGHFKMSPLIVFAIQYCTNSCQNVPTVLYSTVLYNNVSAQPRRGQRFTIELYCTIMCRLDPGGGGAYVKGSTPEGAALMLRAQPRRGRCLH